MDSFGYLSIWFFLKKGAGNHMEYTTLGVWNVNPSHILNQDICGGVAISLPWQLIFTDNSENDLVFIIEGRMNPELYS